MQKNVKVKTNFIQRLFGRGDQPAPDVVPADVNHKFPADVNHKFPPARERQVIARQSTKGTFYVGLSKGYLVAVPHDNGADYSITEDVRCATPFTSFGLADKHGKRGVRELLNYSQQYYAIMASH